MELAKTVGSVNEMAEVLGVDPMTVRRWRDTYPSFASALPVRRNDRAGDQLLSDSYIEMLRLLSTGHTPQQIGAKLDYNTNSVHESLARMRDRLGCKTTAQLSAEAVRRKIIK